MAVQAIETRELTKHFITPLPLRQLVRSPRSLPGRADRSLRTIIAVDRVSLDIQQGELFGLLGPNGAGKTTLIKLLCTVVVPSSGSAHLLGINLQDDRQVREIVGMASGDERSFYWRLSGRQNLEFFATLYGLQSQVASRRIEQLLAQVDLIGEADRPFRTYSSGQKQRLSIARALLHHPRILFLDEPTRSLDPTATLALHKFIEEELLQQEGMTILLTTHRLDEAQRLCNRLAIMDKGRIRAQGTPEQLRSMLGPTTCYHIKVANLPVLTPDLVESSTYQLTAKPTDERGVWCLELSAPDSETALAHSIQNLTAAGGQILEVKQERPSLEEVFQRFTRDWPS
jgi:ABC-2 type transport system ATP-binding protein